ncbi:hypothetical protein SRABI83_04297 [Arthrobacter sp. Bi83]|nr:hypothetical protein [Arthrobacter sp. Bi83]CAH0293956.1 hypothetical protein SRABI83_04297 [Arthrobacter sp. Bi83]
MRSTGPDATGNDVQAGGRAAGWTTAGGKQTDTSAGTIRLQLTVWEQML